MALFGNGGFFDEMFSSFKEDPLQNIASGGLFGAFRGIKKNPQDLLLPGFEDSLKLTGNLFGKGMAAFSEGLGMQQQSEELESELGVKSSMRGESELVRARKARARTASLLTTQNTNPSLLG